MDEANFLLVMKNAEKNAASVDGRAKMSCSLHVDQVSRLHAALTCVDSLSIELSQGQPEIEVTIDGLD
jgi:hypothetical protein